MPPKHYKYKAFISYSVGLRFVWVGDVGMEDQKVGREPFVSLPFLTKIQPKIL